MNNDLVVRAVDLKKVYRLYAKPSYRFRDMFGLLGDTAGAFTEHAALDGVNLEVRRGEKVAIIGRNGAGKSTFLKLVTSVIQPTSGVLEVHAQVHALLQIGTGFTPNSPAERTYTPILRSSASPERMPNSAASTSSSSPSWRNTSISRSRPTRLAWPSG